jgi:actin-like ATPase involved in cell morphogenesis/tetratricopeptide (TPR) repeat protein
MNAEDAFLGIDFGTSNSSVAWYNPKTGQAEALRNAEGEDKTPSVVYYGERETLVGAPAEDVLECCGREQAAQVITSVKSQIARARAWPVPGKQVRPVEVAAEVFKKLRRDAEELHFHRLVTRAVVACPATFDQTERDRIEEAAKLAGFREIELLDEPVAAALAYTRAGLNVGHYVLVYDLGGGTFDLALLAREEGTEGFRVAAEPRGLRCGGDDFDRVLYQYLDQKLQEKFGQRISPDGIDLKFLRECRRRKVDLSAREEIPFGVPVPGRGRATVSLRRDRFEKLIARLVEPTIELTRSILEEARRAGHAVDTVVLIGGSSRVPLVARRLKETLPVEPKRWQHQDLAVALGAAYHAQRLWGGAGASRASPVPPNRADPQDRTTRPSGGPGSEAQGVVSQARLLLERAAKLQEERSEAARAVGQEAVAAALRCAQAACDLEPNWPDASFLKGQILQDRGEWFLAAAAFTACLRAAPDHPEAYCARGFCRLMAGDAAQAKQDFDQAIRRGAEEVLYTCRAVASLRMGNARAALEDIEAALACAEKEVPPAALKTIGGLLLLQDLNAPEAAVGWFRDALALLPQDPGHGPDQGLAERAVYSRVCHFFGLADRLVVESMPKAPNLNLVSSGKPDWRRAASGRDPRICPETGAPKAWETRPPLVRSATIEMAKPVASLQRALWTACKAAHGGCTRAAVACFHDNCKHPPDNAVWRSDATFALHTASIWAEKGDNGPGVVNWLKELLALQPSFDIRVAQRDPWIRNSRDPGLRAFLSPSWTYREAHGLVMNYLTITNLSPFRITSVVVTLAVTRQGGKAVRPFSLHLPSLGAGASHRWEGAFTDTGWFGGNIQTVRVALTCAEAEENRVPASGPGGADRDAPAPVRKDKAVPCPSCRGLLRVSGDLVGQCVKCPQCGTLHAVLPPPSTAGQLRESNALGVTRFNSLPPAREEDPRPLN